MAPDDPNIPDAGQPSTINTKATGDIEVDKNSTRESSSNASGELLEKEKAEVAVQPPPEDAKVDIVEDLAHLPEHQQEILRRQLLIPEITAGYFSCYRYASGSDKAIIAVSVFASIAAGAALPLMTIVYGGLADTMKNYGIGVTSKSDFTSELDTLTLYFVYLGIGTFVATYVSTYGFIYTGEHITQKIREEYLQAILRQNIAIFDTLGAGEITTKITADTALIQDGISEKVALTIVSISTFIAAFVIGFIRSWKLTLILSCSVVAMVLGMGAIGGLVQAANVASNQAYSAGGTIAEEAFSAIRTTVAFGKQKDLAKRYAVSLTEGKKYGIRGRVWTGLMVAWMFFVMWAAYALAFWQGSKFFLSGEIELSTVITVLMASIIGAFSLGFIAPNIPAFGKAAASVAQIYRIIERKSPMDPTDDTGDKLDHVEGTVELRHIDHVYPSRPKTQVLHDISLVIPAGKITALVGASGCGKSTIVGLVERFYDPIGGEVLLDGVNIQTLNLKWLRQNIKLVSQEPDLFSDTIYRNVSFGLFGTEHENATEEEKLELVRKACQMANIDSFITSLPDGYDTKVGERGFLMSGGQKQRIAIARAIVSNPKILLLDEATSALDTTSEGVVQAALDTASRGRTTITIAHRLSTIKNADNIVVLAEGRIIEQGTHDNLIDAKGAYWSLVEAQKLTQSVEAQEASGSSEEESPIERVLTERSLKSADPNDEKPGNLYRTETGKSKSSMALEGKNGEKPKNYSMWELGKFTLSFNKNEIGLILFGIISTIIVGVSQPVQGILFAKSVMSLSLPPDQKDRMRKDSELYSLLYFVLALTCFISYIIDFTTLGISAERLIEQGRKMAIANILRQDIAFFDKEENATGALVTFLTTQTNDLAGISGITLGTIAQAAFCIIASFGIGLGFGWKLALVCMATIPIVIGAGFLRFYIIAQFQQRSRTAYEHSANYACEATNSIRTVASLTKEGDVLATYHGFMREQKRKSAISVAKSSSLYAASQSLTFLCFALAFWYGGRLIANREYDLFQFFVVITSVIFGAQSAGTVFSFAPDMGKAKQAAQELKHLVDSVPTIDTWANTGEALAGDEKYTVEGSIEFRDVHFRYPTRPNVPVLRGLNLTVKPGQYVAICGASGCGKSTIIGLLERFYDPLHGGIYVDGKEISSLNVNDYREKLALVGQEPMLYSGSVGENILMGTTRDQLPDGDIPEVGTHPIWDEVEKACKDANIHEFITSLPQGYSTLCGTKSKLLSGGQKQRIALSRALIRNPRILLLDEATSALDSHSEKIVQAALDRAAKGRTTIAVAHRLSTIQNADVIYVIHEGRVAESGTHRELVERRGRYWELVRLQSLEKGT